MTETTNVEIARRGFEAAMRGDLDAIRELLDPEIKWHGGNPSEPGSCHNGEEALAFMRAARSARRGQAVGDLVDLVGAGDKVVVIMRRLPEDGEPGPLSANLTTFRDGKAVAMVHYADPADALAAAGAPKQDH